MAADSTGLVGNSNVVLNIQNKKALDLNNTLDTLNINTGVAWTFGTGANCGNLLWHDSRSTDATGETINVYDGSEKNAFGTALTMEAIKLLYIKNTHASLTLEVLGGSSADIAICANNSDIIEIPPGGFLLWVCPTAAGIVTTTNKNLKLASKTAGTITYDIVMLGLD